MNRTDDWTPQAVIDLYPSAVRADRLSAAALVLALLLFVAGITLIVSSMAYGVYIGVDAFIFFKSLLSPNFNTTNGIVEIFQNSLVAVFEPIMFALVLGTGVFISRLSKKLFMKRIGQRMLASSDAPIIFLRSFGTDAEPVPPPNFVSLLLRRQWYPEEVFVKEASKWGPVLAVASPHARLPSIGAGKIYVADSHWQSVVREFCSHAALVVLRVGDTEGIRWELEMLSKKVVDGLSVALLFCRSRGEPAGFDDYQAFLQEIPDTLRAYMPLPDQDTSKCVYRVSPYGRRAESLIRYILVRPDSSRMIAVSYDPMLEMTAEFSPFRAEEFRGASLELLSLALPNRVSRQTMSR